MLQVTCVRQHERRGALSTVGVLVFQRNLTVLLVLALLLLLLQVDADWEDWLAAVMRLLLGFPMRLQLPLDRYEQPDFMDAC